MANPQHFTFAGARFDSVIAHEGRGHIAAARVHERAPHTGATFVDLVVVPPGASIGPHTHAASDEEAYVIVDGCGTMLVDGESIAVGAGDVIVNRPGGTHGLDNTGDGPLRLVVVDVAVERP